MIHFILYYFNIDYLNILKENADIDKQSIHIQDEKTKEILDQLETSQKTLEESLNELKQMSTIYKRMDLQRKFHVKINMFTIIDDNMYLKGLKIYLPFGKTCVG